MRIAGEALRALLPHGGAMCLLDAVESWDAERIVCVTTRHRDPANPLGQDGRVGALAGIELAAQAMAAHGALRAGTGRPMAGWLARVRDCVLECDRMDDLAPPLVIEAERIAASDAALAYRFTVRSDGRIVASGSALIALTAQDAA